METLHQEPQLKSKDLFFGETSIFMKMPIFLETFRPFSCEKLCTQGTLGVKSGYSPLPLIV